MLKGSNEGWVYMTLTLDLSPSCNMSAAQLSLRDLIMKSQSPLLGGHTLALVKAADLREYPKCRVNCWKSNVLAVLVINVFHMSLISPLVISGWTSNLKL